jgi:hypothetical protein
MSGKPAFIYCDYADAATVTATDSLAGTDPLNVLNATEDNVWSPADATGTKLLRVNNTQTLPSDSITFLGDNLNGLDVFFGYKAQPGNIITNSEFTTDADGWTLGTGWVYDGAGAGSIKFSGTTFGQVTQTVPINTDKRYTVSISFSVSDVDLRIRQGSKVVGTILASDLSGTFYFDFDAGDSGVSTTFTLEPQNIGTTPAITVILVYNQPAVTLATQNNTAIGVFGSQVAQFQYDIRILNPSTSLQIAHVCPDVLIEQPWLDKDPIAEDVSPTFNNLVSSGGLFLGNNQINTMRAIEIDFGEVTDSEYTGQIEPWVDACIKVARPFYFLPDSTDTSEIYFCWLEDNEGFRAPLINGNRTVSAIAAKTRLI